MKKLTACRICKNPKLVPVIDLGIQSLTGIFPRALSESVPEGPLQLVKCDPSKETCGLVQLAHSYEPTELYGSNYGYRSGLNPLMVNHLMEKVRRIESLVPLAEGDTVLDIGSNDGTTLSFYPRHVNRIAIDPVIPKFEQYYDAEVIKAPEFFSAKGFFEKSGGKKARVVTSFAMMYDLEDPVSFIKEVSSVLTDDGIWEFEQSYMPTMVERCAFDTICHEHLEYYSLKQIVWMLAAADLALLDVSLNDVNGGSISVTAGRSRVLDHDANARILRLLQQEEEGSYDSLDFLARFSDVVENWKHSITDLVGELVQSGATIGALGASTKGNVLLQYAGLRSNQVLSIGDINPDKWGAFTPGTRIPIESEEAVLKRSYDYYIVLPWHFRRHFVSNKQFQNRKLIFPLPKLEIVQM